ncbi:MAG: 30S ribosomal protein S16, partial [Acidimicrobiales bacterium]
MAPQALERSVLERKERDELAAIAEAMGAKPTPRASKATLIDTILREAGIETAPEKPKRARTSKAAAAAAAAAAANGA